VANINQNLDQKQQQENEKFVKISLFEQQQICKNSLTSYGITILSTNAEEVILKMDRNQLIGQSVECQLNFSVRMYFEERIIQ